MKNNEIPKYVTQARAANLLGLPVEEICRISQEIGIGHKEKAGVKEEWFFTYEELQKICLLVAHTRIQVVNPGGLDEMSRGTSAA